MKIIGIDYSTNPKKRGLTIADYSNDALLLEYIGLYSEELLVKTLEENTKILITLDAPLGWPINMGTELSNHEAGIGFDISSNQLFRRNTDLIVKRVTGKQPLDVGADKIARAAYGALNMIDELRYIVAHDIELAWNAEAFEDNSDKQIRLIEVYPAVTLKQHALQFDKYKKKEADDVREMISKSLLDVMSINEVKIDNMIKDDNILDSVVCILAGVDFLTGKCLIPEDLKRARKEGWIWFKSI